MTADTCQDVDMPHPRSYTDEQLRVAVAESANWSAVMVAIGKKPGSGTKNVKALAERLGLDTSHFAHRRSFKPIPAPASPFNREAMHGGHSGLSIAARWFIERGYNVALPLEPAPYDLITESDAGLKRVQVKTTRQRKASGRYMVRTARLAHNASAARNANGSRQLVPYSAEEIDFFFIATPVSSYLIPVEIVGDRFQIVLDEKYKAFKLS
jgi:hypothetical protein